MHHITSNKETARPLTNVASVTTSSNETSDMSFSQTQARTKPLRILMVTGIYPTPPKPHAGTFIQSQVESLVDAGLQVEIIHPKPGPVPYRYASAAIQVFHKTLNGRFDIVHGHYGLWCLAGRLQWKTPVVTSFLGSDLLGDRIEHSANDKKTRLVIHISRWLCQRVDAVIVKSEGMKQAAHFNNAFVIPNGVDFSLFHPIPRADARAALGWHNSRYYVLFGNNPNIPRKNFALAQAAIERLQAKGLDVTLVVATGLPQTQVMQCINASNALALPSLIEGSPNIVKETMACNVPVVATDVGDVRQVIGHTNGCAVCPPDPTAFASALEQAILRTEPTTGRRDISHLDRIVVAQQVIAVYEHAIHNHSYHWKHGNHSDHVGWRPQGSPLQ
ncbi:MAG TPA: glycosyltransferase [Ktedonobacteraceae bacterium]|nr:glycosyltransferase [Ktedonobacteraceae bacterium]